MGEGYALPLSLFGCHPIAQGLNNPLYSQHTLPSAILLSTYADSIKILQCVYHLFILQAITEANEINSLTTISRSPVWQAKCNYKG